jgi:hypothetical protein
LRSLKIEYLGSVVLCRKRLVMKPQGGRCDAGENTLPEWGDCQFAVDSQTWVARTTRLSVLRSSKRERHRAVWRMSLLSLRDPDKNLSGPPFDMDSGILLVAVINGVRRPGSFTRITSLREPGLSRLSRRPRPACVHKGESRQAKTCTTLKSGETSQVHVPRFPS